MNEQLIHYLVLISKLTDILKYIKTHFQQDEKDSHDLSSYIQECKTICINIVKSEPLIELFLQEINQEEQQQQGINQTQEQNNIETIIPVPEQDTQNTQNTQDIELKGQLDTLAILLSGTLQTSENEPMSSESFDTLGSGLSRIFKVTDTSNQSNQPTKFIPQLKNEIINNSSNINFEIKRK